jgi:thioredoxin-dependent peroxiredoxin
MGFLNKHKTKLKAGDKAPAFKCIDQDEKEVSLEDFAGKKLVLFFYPQDNTMGCVKECCNLKNNYSALMHEGFTLLGVSSDSPCSHTRFISKYQLPFTLLCDEDRKMIHDYDVWGLKTILGVPFIGLVRTTFIVNERGIIEGVIDNVDTDNHASQILTLTKLVHS